MGQRIRLGGAGGEATRGSGEVQVRRAGGDEGGGRITDGDGAKVVVMNGIEIVWPEVYADDVAGLVLVIDCFNLHNHFAGELENFGFKGMFGCWKTGKGKSCGCSHVKIQHFWSKMLRNLIMHCSVKKLKWRQSFPSAFTANNRLKETKRVWGPQCQGKNEFFTNFQDKQTTPNFKICLQILVLYLISLPNYTQS